MQVPTALSVILVQCALLAHAFQEIDYEMLLDDDFVDWVTPEEVDWQDKTTKEAVQTVPAAEGKILITSSKVASGAAVLTAHWMHVLCSLVAFQWALLRL